MFRSISGDEDDVDDVLNEFAGNVPFAAGLSVGKFTSSIKPIFVF